MADNPDDCRTRIMAPRPMPAWNTHGPGPAAVLVWLPVLLIDPVTGSAGRDDWFGWPLIAGLSLAFGAAVVGAYRPVHHGARYVLGALVVLSLLGFGGSVYFGEHWFTVFTVVALAWGSVGPPRWSAPTVLLIAILAAGCAWWTTGRWDPTWVSALTTVLCGLTTYSLHRLVAVVAQLDSTRQALAVEAVDAERLRFARDLHDLLGHTLSVVVVKAEAVRRLLPDDTTAAAQHAGDIESIGRDALRDVRNAVTGYREVDVSSELHRARIALDAAGIALHIDRSQSNLPSEVDILFGWVVREAVTNVIRHSRARHCRIGIRAGDGQARLTVVDDGVGGGSAGGRGIAGLTERAAAVGGRLEVAHSPDGFRLSASVPLRALQEAA